MYGGPRESMEKVEKLVAFGVEMVREQVRTVLGLKYDCEVKTVLHGGAKWTLRRSSAGTVTRNIQTVSYGDVVQILCRPLTGIGDTDAMVWLESGNADLQPSIWMFVAAVEIIPQLSEEEVEYVPDHYRNRLCALLIPMKAEGEKYRVMSVNEVRVLATFGGDVRKLLAIHACADEICVGGVKCEILMRFTCLPF